MPDASPVNYYDSSSIGAVTEADQSRLYYHRPLGDGDVISYEFLYEPGQVMVAPGDRPPGVPPRAAGRQAALDDPGGNDLSGLPADNAIDEPANRRGPAPLPLEARPVERLEAGARGRSRSRSSSTASRSYERPMEPTLGRQFGLFHYKDQTSSQVRNVVLKGNWPEPIPDRLRTDLAAIEPLGRTLARR